MYICSGCHLYFKSDHLLRWYFVYHLVAVFNLSVGTWTAINTSPCGEPKQGGEGQDGDQHDGCVIHLYHPNMSVQILAFGPGPRLDKDRDED